MWYEVLPSFIITTTCAGAAMFLPPMIRWVFNPDRKYTTRFFRCNQYDNYMYVRDLKRFGSLYKPQGLEALDNLEGKK